MLLLIPFLISSGLGFWTALIAGWVLTTPRYAGMIAVGPRIGIRIRAGARGSGLRRAPVAGLDRASALLLLGQRRNAERLPQGIRDHPVIEGSLTIVFIAGGVVGGFVGVLLVKRRSEARAG